MYAILPKVICEITFLRWHESVCFITMGNLSKQRQILYLLFTKIYYVLYIIHLLRRNCGPKILVRAAHIIKRRSADRSVLLIICVRPRLAAAVGWVGLWRISRDCVGAGCGHWTVEMRQQTRLLWICSNSNTLTRDCQMLSDAVTVRWCRPGEGMMMRRG